MFRLRYLFIYTIPVQAFLGRHKSGISIQTTKPLSVSEKPKLLNATEIAVSAFQSQRFSFVLTQRCFRCELLLNYAKARSASFQFS